MSKAQGITNVRLYRDIAVDAHAKMVELTANQRRPREDRKAGSIITYDPSQESFRQAMIALVFGGMWLEARLHVAVVGRLGLQGLKQIKKKTDDRWEDKLAALEFSDPELLKRVERFRQSRNDLVHEKAYIASEIRVAQVEASEAIALMGVIDGLLVTNP